MAEIQIEFDFLKEKQFISAEKEMQQDEYEEMAKEYAHEFEILCDKYSISEEDKARIADAAKFVFSGG